MSYSSPPLSWNIAYPILLPWPDVQAGISIKPKEPQAIWPTRYFGVDTRPAEGREIIDLEADDTQDERMSARELSDSIVLWASRASRRVPRPRRSIPARAQQRVCARRLHPSTALHLVEFASRSVRAVVYWRTYKDDYRYHRDTTLLGNPESGGSPTT